MVVSLALIHGMAERASYGQEQVNPKERGNPQDAGQATQTAKSDFTRLPKLGQAAKVKPVKAAAKLGADQRAEASLWMDQLAANEFATRERAAEKLLALGKSVVPMLRERMESSPDPEVRLRTRVLIAQLQDGDFEEKVAAFLAGKDVPFEGWEIFKRMFRDSHRSRDLFVDLVRGHPELVKSFHGTARDRALAMDLVMGEVIRKLQTPSLNLSVADGIALLLPVSDEDVPLGEGYERQMLMVLRLSPVSRAMSDGQTGLYFRGLVNSWLRRSTLPNRVSVLNYAMQADLDTAYDLAVKTLDETTEGQVLASAMQAIARFGQKQDTTLVTKFLDDKRPLAMMMFRPGGAQQRTELGDVAIATIAHLHGVPLTDLGFPKTAAHDKLAFIYEDLLCQNQSSTIAQQRKAARSKVQQLIDHGMLKPQQKEES